MADEMTETLDENRNKIGVKSIKECHDKGLFHRTVGVFIFNDKGELLIQKRGKSMTFFPEKYDFSSSGHVSLGESINEAMKRELKEELGVETDIKLISKDLSEEFDDKNFKVRHFISLFTGKHNGPFKIQEGELEYVKFFNVENIKKIISENPEQFTKMFKICFSEYFK